MESVRASFGLTVPLELAALLANSCMVRSSQDPTAGGNAAIGTAAQSPECPP